MYSTRTRRQRRRSGCNANANTTTKFNHTTGRILRTPPNGPTLTKVTYSTIPKSSKREPTKSMSPKTKKNKKSKGGDHRRPEDQNDSEGLVMDDS
jgi:hypothetical protein